MTTDHLDISAFERAILRLEEGLARHLSDAADTQLRDGLVQRFEFTYELGHRTVRRYLASVSPTPGQFDEMNFQDLIRTASAQGLLRGQWPDWRRYREMRARTSHSYDEEVARAVVAGIPGFLDEVRFLRDRLAERLS